MGCISELLWTSKFYVFPFFLVSLYVHIISFEIILSPCYQCMLAEWMVVCVCDGGGSGGTSLFLAYRSLDKIQIIRCWILNPVLLMGKTGQVLEKRQMYFAYGRIVNNYDQTMDCGRFNMAINSLLLLPSRSRVSFTIPWITPGFVTRWV